MRQVTFTFATITQSEICATNATAASGSTLVLNGGLSNYGALNSAGYVPYATPGAGIQRCIQVYSTGNISTSTFAFTGLDVNGYAISTSFAGPTGTANTSAKSTSEFAVVFTASVGPTAATSPFTVGFGPSGTTNTFAADHYANPVNMTYALTRAATSGPVTFQHCFENPFTATAPNWTTVSFGSGVLLASQTTATTITVSENPLGVRAVLLATAAATGVIQVGFVQAGV